MMAGWSAGDIAITIDDESSSGAVAERADVDVVIIAGAARTTGAGPGRFPGTIRFTRAVPAEAAAAAEG
jgi:hypothetical protein